MVNVTIPVSRFAEKEDFYAGLTFNHMSIKGEGPAEEPVFLLVISM